jgi:hypothetical protein
MMELPKRYSTPSEGARGRFHPLDKLRVPDMTAFGSTVTVELRLNASGNFGLCSQDGAIVSERLGNRGLRASETRRVARTIALSALEAQACQCAGYTLAVREGSSPAMHAQLGTIMMAGRVSANARTRGMPCRAAGLGIMGK